MFFPSGVCSLRVKAQEKVKKVGTVKKLVRKGILKL